MIVKVAPMGEVVKEANVEAGTTVGEVLDIVGIEHNDRAITVNNASADLDTEIEDENAVISLANKMKGGCK